jgi:hypothetical protein
MKREENASRLSITSMADFLRRAQGSHAGGGVLGRAAESLVTQRGIER